MLNLWNKNFLREVYRNIQTFAFKVLQESSSWASGNGAVQMIFLTPNRNIFAGKFVNWEHFLAVFWEHVISSRKRIEIRKMSEVFWAKLYCKMSDLFDWFLLTLRFSAINSGVKRSSDDVHWNVWAKVVRPKKYFQKRNYKYKILNNLYFGPSFVFGEFTLKCFSQCFFLFFALGQPWWPTFLFSPPVKKASYGPDIEDNNT